MVALKSHIPVTIMPHFLPASLMCVFFDALSPLTLIARSYRFLLVKRLQTVAAAQ
jgi:hypothetical protein